MDKSKPQSGFRLRATWLIVPASLFWLVTFSTLQSFPIAYFFRSCLPTIAVLSPAIALALVLSRKTRQEPSTDLTEHNAETEKLVLAEHIFRQFFARVPEYCYVLSPAGEIADANPAACEALGYTLDELTGRPLSQFCAPEYSRQWQEFLQQWNAGTELRDEETVIVTRQGQRRTVLLNISSVREPDGSILHSTLIQTDITDRKRAEVAAKESEERFRLVADTAPMLIWMSGPEKLCTYFNKAWLDFTGRSIEAELGNGWAEGVHSEDLDRCLEIYHQAFDRREAFRMEYRLRRNDGEYRWIVDIGVPRFRLDGSLAGYIGSCADVTERKRAESDRIIMLEEIAHLNRAASMGQMAASIAHELAQPLAAILSNAQAAARFASRPEPDLDEIRGALADITEDDQRARAFVQNMRAMFQKQTITRAPLELNAMARDVSRLVRHDALRRDIQIRVNTSSDAVQVLGDAIAVQQVLLNLVNNGMDAMKDLPQGQRYLTLTALVPSDSGYGTILVEDNGCGVPEENKSKLFTPFFTTKADGLGMGLSICRSLIESLGGRIALVDSHHAGAVFQVDLPLVTGEPSS